MEFPAEGMELTHILVSGDTGRAERFYVDVLGAELYRRYGESVVLRFLGNWFCWWRAAGRPRTSPR